MIRNRRPRRHIETAELNITAFMNLMVILVPFLLITAVFSRLAVLELNLPGASSEVSAESSQSLTLEITVRTDMIEIGDRNRGLLSRIPNRDGGYDLQAMAEKLQQIKARFPDKLDATLLLEPDISYDVIVQVIDRVRVAELVQGGSLVKAELFPDIAIGDAVSRREGA
jgi:biopolymer transport protein ExbD